MHSFFASWGWKRYAIVAVVILAVVGYFSLRHPSSSPYETIVATAGPMQQIVSETCKVQPQQTVDLGFSVPGTIATVDALVGQHVSVGQTLATLDSSDLKAKLAQAQAQVAAAQATLSGLQAGAQPEDIAASQAAADKAAQDLANMYAGVNDTLSSAYAEAADAVQVQLSPMFSNPGTQTAQLTYSTSNSQSATDAVSDSVAAYGALTAWQTELAGISSTTASTTLDAALAYGITRLATVRTLVQDVSATLQGGTNLSSATLASYKAAATAALTETNAAITSLNGDQQAIAAQKPAVQQAQAQLALKKAGATSQTIAAQEAQVQAAQANVQALEAQIAQTVLQAPFPGVVTRQDAKAGAASTVGTTFVTLDSAGQFEIQCYVAEADIAKVRVGNAANVTLDAYGDLVPFLAKVISIDPAETVIQGVSTYKVDLLFTSAPQPVKSGMTANTDIITATRTGAISVPARAVYEQNGAQYVKILKPDGTVEDRKVTTGIQGVDGSIEITSGVAVGERVITYDSSATP